MILNFTISGSLIIYAGLTLILASLKFLRIYRSTGSIFTRNIFYAAFGIAVGHLFIGLPLFFYSVGFKLVVYGYLIGWTFILAGLIYGFINILDMIGMLKTKKIFFTLAVFLASLVFIIFYFLNPPQPFIDDFKFIHARSLFSLALFQFILIWLVGIFPGIYYLLISEQERTEKFKVVLFGLAYAMIALGSSGIVFASNTLFDSFTLLFISSVFQFLGSLSLGFLIFYQRFQKLFRIY